MFVANAGDPQGSPLLCTWKDSAQEESFSWVRFLLIEGTVSTKNEWCCSIVHGFLYPAVVDVPPARAPFLRNTWGKLMLPGEAQPSNIAQTSFVTKVQIEFCRSTITCWHKIKVALFLPKILPLKCGEPCKIAEHPTAPPTWHPCISAGVLLWRQ
jgi:hypothetical protein